ncbi:MAG: glycine zipper 2TM domain-containing protein [Novosphingobium sp.]|nr:glycine zipper 2TM domain-containing protein [Novosphingobium sp.]
MRFGQIARTASVGTLVALAVTVAAPASAHPHADPGEPLPEYRPDWREGQPRGYEDYQQGHARARDEWLAECRRRVSHRDNGVGGAVIGGLIGGVAGNRIAGRGNRTVGTIAGVAVGAAAGMAIDKAEDNRRERDECETYLDDYYARSSYGQGHAQYGYGYGYPAYSYTYAVAGGCCQPMQAMPMQRSGPECTETVEYEYVDVPAPRPKVRYIPEKRTKVVPDKRIKVVPDKRIQK